MKKTNHEKYTDVDLEENDVIPTKRWKTKLILKLLKYGVAAILLIVGSFYITAGVTSAQAYTSTKIIEAKYKLAETLDLVRYNTKIVPLKQAELTDLVKAYSDKHGFRNLAIGFAMIDKESGGRSDRVRFEQSWKDQYSGKPGFEREPWMTDIEYSFLFSSFGLMQVSWGLFKEECGLTSYSDLLIPATNIDCALKILSECLKRQKNISPQHIRLRVCFKEYNGSGPKAEAYALDIMARIADRQIDDDQLLKDDQTKEDEFIQKYPEIAKSQELVEKKKIEIEEIKVTPTEFSTPTPKPSVMKRR